VLRKFKELNLNYLLNYNPWLTDVTPSNPSVAPVQQEELEEALLDMNVSQRPREEEPPRRVVRTRVDRLVWDCRLFPNPHALAIYLNFVLACGAASKRFEEC
jgi:hypothetical protein